MDDLQQQIERAKELLTTIRHAAMATVNEDGSPHNTPFKFMHDSALTRIYWGSHPESQHSLNVARTGQIFIAVYDAHERGGLYIRAEGGHPLRDEELDEALAVHNALRAAEGKTAIELSYYAGGSPQRMYSADITNLWVLGTERDEQGMLVREYRLEIQASDLVAEPKSSELVH